MRYVLALSALLCVVTISAVAMGDDRADAQRFFQEGRRAYDIAEFKHDRQMYEVAFKAFSQAYALAPTDPHLWNLALSEVDSGRYMQGLAHFRLYDAHEHVLGQPSHPKLRLLSEYMTRARAGLGHLSIEGVAGTAITIDGRPAGVMPLPDQDLEGGPHVVEWLGQRFEFQASAGQTVKMTVAAPPPPPTSAPVASRSPPGPTPDPFPSGPAAASSPEIEPVPTGPSHVVRDVVRWSSSSVAVVAAAVGFGLMAEANGKANDIATYRSEHPSGCAIMTSGVCATTQSMVSSYHGIVTTSQVSLVVAGLGAVGAVTAWTLWPRADLSVAPSVGVRQAGLALTGSF